MQQYLRILKINASGFQFVWPTTKKKNHNYWRDGAMGNPLNYCDCRLWYYLSVALILNFTVVVEL